MLNLPVEVVWSVKSGRYSSIRYHRLTVTAVKTMPPAEIGVIIEVSRCVNARPKVNISERNHERNGEHSTTQCRDVGIPDVGINPIGGAGR